MICIAKLLNALHLQFANWLQSPPPHLKPLESLGNSPWHVRCLSPVVKKYMKKLINLNLLTVLALLGFVSSVTAVPVTFTSGTDPNAGNNSGYAAVRFRNFDNAGGGNGEVYIGNQANLGSVNTSTYGIRNTPWSEQTYAFAYIYNPLAGTATTIITPTLGSVYSVSSTVTVPSASANELQILDRNTKSGDLTLNLNSINSVADGLVTISEATWNAANGAYLQAYLDNATLFNSGFTLNGTISLDAPLSSSSYGNNEGSKIEINLAHVPISANSVPDGGSTLALFGIGLTGVASWRRKLVGLSNPKK